MAAEQFETVAVPFRMIGNRRCLEHRQLVEHPWLADFVQRFPNSFEYCVNPDAWCFIEPDHGKVVE